MLDLVSDWDFSAVGGLTMGADPVAAAMLHAAAAAGRRLDAFVVRKQGKEHGTRRRIEGPDVSGRRVLAVEDTSTTGASVLAARSRPCARPGPRWSAWPWSWTGTPVRGRRSRRPAGLPLRLRLADLGLARQF
jgi:hypothetical protein